MITVTTEDNGHYHVMYANESRQEYALGYAGEGEARHTHSVDIDPETGELMIMPAPDGHTHLKSTYVGKQSPSSGETDKKIADEFWAEYKAVLEDNQKNIDRGNESQKFVKGEQWTETEKKYLEGLQRAAITLNFICRSVDELCGVQREQRTDWLLLPMEGGDQRTADIMNYVMKYVADRCYYSREESKFFRDIVVVGRGAFNVYMSYDESIEGDIHIERYPHDMVMLGAHEKEDLRDCDIMFRERMMSIERVKYLYGDRAEKINMDLDYAEAMKAVSGSGEKHEVRPGTQYTFSDNWMPVQVNGRMIYDKTRKEIRVIDRVIRTYDNVPVFAYPESDYYASLENWKSEDIEALKTISGGMVIRRKRPGFRVTRMAGNTVLFDQKRADIPDFMTVVAYCYKEGNDYWSKVDLAKDAQLDVNKRASQIIDIANKAIAEGYFYDTETFPDKSSEEAARTGLASPGFFLKVSNVNNAPKKESAQSFPAGLAELVNIGEQRVMNMMNVVVEPPNPNESGAAFLQRAKQKLTGNEFLFDNLSFAKRHLGRIILKLIQKHYSAERLLRILKSQMSAMPQEELADTEFADLTEEELLEILENADLSKYDLVVAETSLSPSARTGVYVLLNELMQKGAPVPPQTMVRYMDMPDKERRFILDQFAADAESTAAEQSESRLMEENKTLIAKDIIPPAVQARLDQEAAEVQQSQGPTEGEMPPPGMDPNVA